MRLVGGDLRDQQIDALADDLGLRVSEHPLARRVEGLDDAVLVDREHDVLDVIEDDLQMLGALLARLVRHGPRFVRHEPHRLHDAAALFVDGFVVRTDQAQQHRQVGSGRSGSAAAAL